MRAFTIGVLLAVAFSSAACSSSSDGAVDSGPNDSGPFDCAVSESSNLPGVAIHFTTDKCTFTLAQAAAGITIPYEVKIDRAMTGVVLTPDPLDRSMRVEPDASGLHLFEVLYGGDQHYCQCNGPLPTGWTRTERMLTVGTYPETFHWDGVNWEGGADTATPKGKPFPAGVYDLEVRAFGEAPAPGGNAPFEVKATIKVRLVP